jgi:hypothetical protein
MPAQAGIQVNLGGNMHWKTGFTSRFRGNDAIKKLTGIGLY